MRAQLKTSMTRSLLFASLAVFAALGLLYFLGNTSSVQAGTGILQLSDLPAGAVMLTDNFPAADELSHPLTSDEASSLRSKLPNEKQKLFFGYKTVHRFMALVPAQGVVVMNFAYEYATGLEAQQAAELLQSDIVGAETIIQTSELKGKNGLQGQGFLLKGDEGDSAYWFIGVQGKTLIMLMVNGMQQPSVSSIFESTTQRLMNK